MRSLAGTAVFVCCVAVGTAGFLAAQDQAPAAPAQGQGGGQPGRGRGPAPPPQNLKVLPKNWTRQQVQALMQTFVRSLGQEPPAQGAPAPPEGQGEGCLHCHVPGTQPGPNGRGPAPDFASDENPNKNIARKMIQMVMTINDTTKQVGDQAVAEKVTCWTCHQGRSQPALMPEGGWGRGGFSLLPDGPPMPPARGRGGN